MMATREKNATSQASKPRQRAFRQRGLLYGDSTQPPRPISHGEETTQHLAAFEAWYGNDRSIRAISGIIGIPENTLYDWKKRWGWVERANDRDAEAREIADRAATKAQAQRLNEQRQAGTLLRLRGTEYFQTKEINNGREAIAAIKAGIEIEQRADALPDWILQILNADADELDALERAINERLAGGDAPEAKE
jgi:transposase